MIYESVHNWPEAFFYSVAVICGVVALCLIFYWMDR